MDVGRLLRAVTGIRRGSCGVHLAGMHIANGLSSVSERRIFIIQKWKTLCLGAAFLPCM